MGGGGNLYKLFKSLLAIFALTSILSADEKNGFTIGLDFGGSKNKITANYSALYQDRYESMNNCAYVTPEGTQIPCRELKNYPDRTLFSSWGINLGITLGYKHFPWWRYFGLRYLGEFHADIIPTDGFKKPAYVLTYGAVVDLLPNYYVDNLWSGGFVLGLGINGVHIHKTKSPMLAVENPSKYDNKLKRDYFQFYLQAGIRFEILQKIRQTYLAKKKLVSTKRQGATTRKTFATVTPYFYMGHGIEFIVRYNFYTFSQDALTETTGTTTNITGGTQTKYDTKPATHFTNTPTLMIRYILTF